VERLLADIEDAEQRGDLEAKQAELDQMMAALSEQEEVTAAEAALIFRPA
jgi:hypothetical protein